MSCTNLLVITIERRCISVAAFTDLRLEYLQTRQLSSDFDLARVTAKRFVSWAIAALQPERLLLELPGPHEGRRRADLRDAIKFRLSAHTGPRTWVAPDLASRSLGIARPLSRSELQAVARSLWPGQAREDSALLAAATGLSEQMIEIFINTKSS
jgi:hypothetical protein